MFDLIEESLSQEGSNPSTAQNISTQSKQDSANVYVMPEKFLPKLAKSKASPIVVVLVIVLLLGSAAGGGYLYYMQGKQQITPVEMPVPTNQQPVTTPENTTPSQTEGSTTTTETTGEVKLPPAPISYVDSIDTDRDGLTDVEEQLFGTSQSQPDTDSDGYLDAGELKSLFDPTKIDGAKLENSGFVSRYQNKTFQYSLLYPSAWVAQATDTSNREVLLSSSTGEFVSIAVQDNPEKLSAVDWYSSVKSPGFDTSKLQSILYGQWSGATSEDGMEFYLTQKDSSGQTLPYVYIVSYKAGGKTELNFRSTLQMLVRSLMTSLD